jgi:hypothetical protein
MLQCIKFPIKVWVTGIFIGPILAFTLFDLLVNNHFKTSTYGAIYVYAVLIGSGLSAPYFLLLRFCYLLSVKKRASILFIRITLSILSVVSCITVLRLFPFTSFMKFWTMENLILIASYSIPLIAGVSLYKIENGVSKNA